MKPWLFLAAVLSLPATAAFAHGDSHSAKPAAAKSAMPAEETAFGRAGDGKKVTRTVDIDMVEMRFTPATLEAKQGDTVRFRVRNSGALMHEMVIGTPGELKAHAEMMKKHPGMEHDEPYMAHVAPTKTETIVWQFTRTGEFKYACLIPGHFESGMVGTIKVAAAASSTQR